MPPVHRLVNMPAMILAALFLFTHADRAVAGEVLSRDFTVTLFPITTQRWWGGKRTFRIKVRLVYQGKSPLRLMAGENLYVRSGAGFLERSIYFGSDPEFQMCGTRQVVLGAKSNSKPSVKTLNPGQVLEEEWRMEGIDINSATYDGQVVDWGSCMDAPGPFLIRAVFAAWTSSYDRLYSPPSNEQQLEIPKDDKR